MRTLSLLGLLSLLISPVGAQVRINEFMASNNSVAPDNADFDDYSDWIELHNTSSSAVSLNGYFLSDDLTAPTKWGFPSNASIPAGGFLVVRADGFNANPGETHVRGYYPWGSTFTTRRNHTSFKLSADGEAIGLFRTDTPPGDQTLIAKHSTWKYRDLGTDPGGTWMDSGYDDGSWSQGNGPLGYNDSWISTTVSYGPNSSSKYATTYFRHHFNVSDPATISSLRLNLMVDDSAIVYLNGTEISRVRMPAGTVSYNQYSGQLAPTENVYENIELGTANLMTGDNVLAVEVHQEAATSSDVSFDVELIGAALPTASTTQTFVAKNSIWNYRDLGTDPGGGWMANVYDDSTWSSGSGVLGYGDNWISTTVSYGSDANNKFPTTYFRRHFSISDPAAITSLALNLMADDSAVVYLNGTEVTRLRMPAGTVNHNQYSGILAPAENIYETFNLSSSHLIPGDNVLAVEVHQEAGTSSDVSFDAELTGLVLPSPPTLVDSVAFGLQTTDVSMGRDATDAWVSFGVPTPGAANTPTPLAEPFVTSPSVSVSADSGFYDSALSVALSGGPAGTLHYTLDGSDPQPGSPVYSAALAITSTTILRARIYEDGKIPGPVLTRSYFLNGDASPGLPVFSFVADPGTMFGNDIGIYQNDTAYPFKGREVPIRLEFFEQDKSPGFAVNAGTKIAGENIWLKAQKPFNVYCRGKYGDDFIPYQLFPGEPSANIAELNLRNGGDDWEETLLRDAMMPSVLNGQMDASFYSYRPSILYLNGEFWGIYNMRRRMDSLYFATQKYLGADEFDLVAYAHDEAGVTRLTAEEGSTDRYEEFLGFVTANDPADPAVYSQIAERMNIDSFIDYVVATDFAVNTSWSHNREFWCGHPAGSKWEWIINDFDRGFDTANITGSLIDDFRASYTLFQRMDNSSTFVDRLIQRYAAHLGSTFVPQRFDDVFDALVAEQDPEVSRHIARWSASGGFNASARLAQIAEIKQFVVDRPANALSRLQTELGISRTMSPFSFAASPSTGGNIRVAGVEMQPAYNSTVNLFNNTPVEITAEPAPGYSFVSWSNGSTDPTITVTLTSALSLTANFASGAETVLPLSIANNTTLTAVGSPYLIDGDLIVEAGTTLTIDPGVAVLLTEGSSILVHGTLAANGTEGAPILFHSRSGQPWGNISFVDTTTTSTLTHVVIREATVSRLDPLNLKGAVSGYHGHMLLDHVDIEGPEPVFARYGSTTMLHSRIHITFTGDGINVKVGEAHVEGCTFTGNSSVDTDAIDYDGVLNGVIRDNRIYNFRGDNSDGIDVGEGCVNLLVENNRIYNNYDKGVSVGQGSTVTIRQNLIVGCAIGVGVKDAGSTAIIDQNTFAQDDVGVAVYEKNLGAGGGIAAVGNCIFSRSKTAPVTVDSLSTLSVDWSLSDTLPIAGTGNFVADPLFNSPGVYDFSLQPASPAIDAGDPAHATDPDSSRADMGMSYVYDPDDYPFLPPNLVVINEVLTSSPGAPDWIELYNNSNEPLDIGGWYLSDSGSDLQKYQIAAGTIIPGGGYQVFREDTHFGATSGDPGVITPFALSETGDSVHLYKPASGLDLEYHESEDFGAAEPGITFGRYYKSSSATYNFVAMNNPTPGAVNSPPKVGPVVISEIMYHPATDPDAEYIELLNISSNPVTLYDPVKGAGWSITNGVDYTFPTNTPVTLQAGERLVLTRSLAAFTSSFSVPGGTQVLQWTSGGLSNSGESIELGMPGELDAALVRQFIRVDRVNFSDVAPWPPAADGNGPALVRVNPYAYGNDFSNWSAETASPGEPQELANFDQWVIQESLPPGQSGPNDDPDGDRMSNLLEYALGTPPTDGTNPPNQGFEFDSGDAVIEIHLPQLRDDLIYTVEQSDDLAGGNWTSVTNVTLEDSGNGLTLRARADASGPHRFFRLFVSRR